jgi:hypothetical protein
VAVELGLTGADIDEVELKPIVPGADVGPRPLDHARMPVEPSVGRDRRAQKVTSDSAAAAADVENAGARAEHAARYWLSLCAVAHKSSSALDVA